MPLFWAERAAAGVPGAALRVRARTIGAMSAAVLNMDTRGVALAYGDAAGPRRIWFRLRPPHRRELVLAWRDLLAVAGHAGEVSVVAVGSGLALGYRGAAWLCEGARLDAEDPRRSAALPFRFESLAWWHAIVPGLGLFV